MKQCSRCLQVLEEKMFDKAKYGKDGLYAQCKNCRKEYRQQKKEHISATQKKYYQENKDYVLERVSQYRLENKEHIAKKDSERYYSNRENNLTKRKEYYYNNLDKFFEYRQRPDVKARARLNKKERNQSRKLAFEELGYCHKEVIDILIKKAGLTKLTKDWHIDHILPFSMFNHSENIGRCVCWHIDNLRLIPAKENLQKSNSLPENWAILLYELTEKVIEIL